MGSINNKKSRFDAYYESVASSLVTEYALGVARAIPAVISRVAPSLTSRLGKGAADTAASLGAASLGADMLGAVTGDVAATGRLAQQAGQGIADFISTPSPATLPTSTSTPAMAAGPTSTVSPPAAAAPTSTVTPSIVGTPTSTVTPVTDVASAGVTGAGAGTLNPAAAIAGTAAMAVPVARTAARSLSRTAARPIRGGVGGTLPGVGQTGDRSLPGVKDTIVQDKFYI
jgi:hypothetical protein